MAESTQKKVVIYTTPTCPYCRMAKDYLAKKGVAYIERNVAQDREAAREMIEKSRQMGVPVTIVADDIVVGFDQASLDKVLSK